MNSRSRRQRIFYPGSDAFGTGVVFTVAAAQSLAFILTLQQVPHAVGDLMLSLSGTHGVWLFMLLSIVVLDRDGLGAGGAAALIILARCCSLLRRRRLHDPFSHFGVVLVISDGAWPGSRRRSVLFYGACLIGNVPIEQTIRLDYRLSQLLLL